MSRTPEAKHVKTAVTSMFVCAIVVACGSRTGLLVDTEIINDASTTPTPTSTSTAMPPVDAPMSIDGEPPPFFEGGLLDVTTDCPETSYCEPTDLSYIYKCGVRIAECSSLEQCEVRCSGEECGASCINPCRDTLGQNTSNGCEFYSVEMDVTDESDGACFAVFVVNQWKTGEPARLEVDRGGTVLPIEQFARIPVGTGTNLTYAPFDATNGLARDQVAILFLSRDPAAANGQPTDPGTLASCPAGVTPAVVGDAALHGTGTGTAFHIRSNVPIVAYQMLPYGGGRARITGATLLLPTNVWGTNYLAANGYPAPSMVDEDRAGPTMAVIAQADDTIVTVLPTVAITGGGGLTGGNAGAPLTYSLHAGQYLQFTQPAELTGSAITSNNPIAVIGGNTLADIPLDAFRADSTEQMLPPLQALGSEYVAVRYRARANRGDESVPWRLVGAVDGTLLTYDPVAPAGAQALLNAHQIVEFQSPGPFTVHSQDDSHPFYFAQYMTGGQVDFDAGADPFEPLNGEGDPEYLNVTPPAQFLPRYTFFTDPTYPETNLVVTRVRDSASGLMPDIALDCAGTLSGWAPVGNAGTYEFTRIDLSTGNFQGQNGCDNGVHSIIGTFPGDAGAGTPTFGVNIWGWGNGLTDPNSDEDAVDEANPKFTRWVSYAYPAGANFQPLNSVILPTH